MLWLSLASLCFRVSRFVFFTSLFFPLLFVIFFSRKTKYLCVFGYSALSHCSVHITHGWVVVGNCDSERVDR